MKGEEGGVAVSGCRGSVECWWLQPEAQLGLTSGLTTFLSSLCRFKGLWTLTAQIVCDLTISVRSLDCDGVCI